METINVTQIYIATTKSDITLQPSIDYAKRIASTFLEVVNNVMATVMCGTIKVTYKVTGW